MLEKTFRERTEGSQGELDQYLPCSMQLNPVDFPGTPFITQLSPIDGSWSCFKHKVKLSVPIEQPWETRTWGLHIMHPRVHPTQFWFHICSGDSCTGTRALNVPSIIPQQVSPGTTAPSPIPCLGAVVSPQTSHQTKDCKESLDLILESQGIRAVSRWSLNFSRWFQ